MVSHEIEPFVALATRAVGVDSGDVRLVDPLPQDAVRRTALLEALAAGEALASCSHPVVERIVCGREISDTIP